MKNEPPGGFFRSRVEMLTKRSGFDRGEVGAEHDRTAEELRGP